MTSPHTEPADAFDLSSWMLHPHRIAVDAKGYVWRAYPDMWSEDSYREFGKLFSALDGKVETPYHTAEVVLASDWYRALRDDRDYQRHRAERAERRCWAEHPTNSTAVDCCLDRGHEGDHWSTTGCAGSHMSWPQIAADPVDAPLADPRVAQLAEAVEVLRIVRGHSKTVHLIVDDALRDAGSPSLAALVGSEQQQ